MKKTKKTNYQGTGVIILHEYERVVPNESHSETSTRSLRHGGTSKAAKRLQHLPRLHLYDGQGSRK